MMLQLTTTLLVIFLLSPSAGSSGAASSEPASHPPGQVPCTEGQHLLDSAHFMECKKTVFARLVAGGYQVSRMLQDGWKVRMLRTYLIINLYIIFF